MVFQEEIETQRGNDRAQFLPILFLHLGMTRAVGRNGSLFNSMHSMFPVIGVSIVLNRVLIFVARPNANLIGVRTANVAASWRGCQQQNKKF
jgi:hypothetical protein